MGEMAEMMLGGTVCQGCGEFLHDGEDGPGFPGWCERCMPEDGLAAGRKHSPLRPKRPRTIPCPVPGCNRMFNSYDAMRLHRKAKEH